MRPFRLAAVLFDFDGTLTKPDALDFAAMRAAIGCPDNTYVLEYILSLPPGDARDAAFAKLEEFELTGAHLSEPNEGAEELVRDLRARGLRLGVITRNGRAAVDIALRRFAHLTAADFDVIVTRDDALPHKPAPDGILHAAEKLGVPPERMLMVGDYHLDVEAGRAAGAVTAYLDAETREPRIGPAIAEEASWDPDADFTITRLDGLRPIVRLGLPLPRGKLPNDLLAAHLAATADRRGGAAGVTRAAAAARVILGAAVGEDVAALDVGGDDVVVAHGDPITLTSGDLGRFAVLVNSNDIATSGAEPRWFLTTVLLPRETTGSEALSLLDAIETASEAAGIVVVGGHTEITEAVVRPVVAGTMLGVVGRRDLRDKRSARPGDHILMTKALAVEGTALLAAELPGKLRALGMKDEELAGCLAFVDRMSILPEARIAAGFAGVRALHDITEGGVATALDELSSACGHAIVVRREQIRVYPETERVCALLGADPLGLIASGSLLIVCDPDESPALLDALTNAGVQATSIATFGDPGHDVQALDHGRTATWPRFARDEAARLLTPTAGSS